MCLSVIQCKFRIVILIRVFGRENIAFIVDNGVWVLNIFVKIQFLLLDINFVICSLFRFLDTRNRIRLIRLVASVDGRILMDGTIYQAFNTVIKLALVEVHKAQCLRFDMQIRN